MQLIILGLYKFSEPEFEKKTQTVVLNTQNACLVLVYSDYLKTQRRVTISWIDLSLINGYLILKFSPVHFLVIIIIPLKPGYSLMY